MKVEQGMTKITVGNQSMELTNKEWEEVRDKLNEMFPSPKNEPIKWPSVPQNPAPTYPQPYKLPWTTPHYPSYPKLPEIWFFSAQ
jgi:hypothetical protein